MSSALSSATLPWIDTHCHLHDKVFDEDIQTVVQQARQAGVKHVVLPATHPADWAAARGRAHQIQGYYTWGIHPWWASSLEHLSRDLDALKTALDKERGLPGSRLVALGEMGLDFAKPERATAAAKAQQQAVLEAQLDLATTLDLPVVLHLCRAGDLAYLLIKKRLHQGRFLRGVVHAFRGSMEQARAWLSIGFKLGVGGAATYPQAKRLHSLLRDLPRESWVLETDAPFMSPVWLQEPLEQVLNQSPHQPLRNSPVEIPRIGRCLAELAGVEVAEWAATTTETARVLLALPSFLERNCTSNPHNSPSAQSSGFCPLLGGSPALGQLINCP
jgi:TatD DNase family protein